ncbi:hypothetical protein [Streptomyces cahuitamycinicus]|uniref:hypothetical protein n=1 Tax=Streptomyces cahuitamycinicus TaxID=2070367 RepID=UPI0015E12EBB|nr:hypothetical protein [Streptomyces cahuitamycinicus]
MSASRLDDRRPRSLRRPHRRRRGRDLVHAIVDVTSSSGRRTPPTSSRIGG